MNITIIVDGVQQEEFTDIMSAREFLSSLEPMSVTMCRIGGYELLRDGTREDGPFFDIEKLKDYLDDWGIEYTDIPKDVYELAEEIESQWSDKFDDGGGSGWIEYN
jgi:hypothetical protein